MVDILYNYEKYLSMCYAETTKERYIGNVKLYFRFLEEYKHKKITGTLLLKVTKEDIIKYIIYMNNLNWSTKDVRLASIKNFYSYLNQDLSSKLFRGIKIYKTEIKLPRILSSNESNRLLNYYSDKRNSLIIFIFLTTGIRISELANILIENINFQEKYIYMKVKGGIWRKVFINEKLSQKLQDFIQNRTEGKLFKIKRRAIDYIVKNAMRELGISGSAHTLRHTFATVMYRETKDILLVKDLLGHKHVSSTEIYTHIENEFVKQAVELNPFCN